MVSIEQALELITAQARSFGTEKVSVYQALNRILAEDLVADRDYPPFNRATMDGYAVQSADFLEGGVRELDWLETILAGTVATQQVLPGTCIKIMTGAPVPAGADAVIKVEETEAKNGKVLFETKSFKAGQNIARQGEDAHQGDVLIKRNQRVDAAVISALAVIGQQTVEVHRLPTISVLSTGNEVVPFDSPILPHQIRDSNSFSIRMFFRSYEVHSVYTGLLPDDKQELADSLRSLLNKDMIILSGGVSKGDADHIPEVLRGLGVKELFHRVQIKPGAPLWFGVTPSGGVVFGLPGNPVSVQVACKIFIEAYLRACFGLAIQQPLFLPLATARTTRSAFDEYFPCRIDSTSGLSRLVPLRYNGSGDIAATLQSDGLALHPATAADLAENAVIAFYGWR